MQRIITFLLATGIMLAFGRSAAALCICGEGDGSSVAAACGGKTPGDECGRKRTCKIVAGSSAEAVCACACSKGVGPKSCDYAAIGAVDLPADVSCGSEALGRFAGRVEEDVNADLAQAESACWLEKNALRRANRARQRLRRLWKKIERAAKRERIDGACAATSLAAVDALQVRIDDLEAGDPTTSTTLPVAPSCAAAFLALSEPGEVDFEVGCFAAGASYQGFQLTMNGGRTVETFLAPPGFVCTITTEVTANDSLACVGDFVVDVQVIGGRVRTSPTPEPGMDASLFVLVGDARYGPFRTTGP
jgi:hypothetical protein